MSRSTALIASEYLFIPFLILWPFFWAAYSIADFFNGLGEKVQSGIASFRHSEWMLAAPVDEPTNYFGVIAVLAVLGWGWSFYRVTFEEHFEPVKYGFLLIFNGLSRLFEKKPVEVIVVVEERQDDTAALVMALLLLLSLASGAGSNFALH